MEARRRPSPDIVQRTATQMRKVFDEGSPDVIRGVSGLFEVDEVFEWIKRAHPASTANTARDKITALKQSWGLSPDPPVESLRRDPGRSAELYRDGGLVLDPSPYLPQPDERFESWVQKTRAALGGEFGMQAPGIECASWDAFERLAALLEPILAVTGPRSHRFNAFGGDYRLTPFGFHVDPHQEAVFQVVLSGRRRGFFWEGLTLSEDEDAVWVEDSNRLHEPRREPDVVLDLEPGDIVFWPGTHVHGFETRGPSLALSIVVDRASPRRKEDVVTGLEVATLMGRAALPPVDAGTSVGSGQMLRRRTGARLGYERFDDTLVVGVCGRSFDWPDRNSIPLAMALFEHLRAQDEVAVDDVVQSFGEDELDGDEIIGTLSMLVGLGYFDTLG